VPHKCEWRSCAHRNAAFMAAAVGFEMGEKPHDQESCAPFCSLWFSRRARNSGAGDSGAVSEFLRR